jgi:hypothetical protein
MLQVSSQGPYVAVSLLINITLTKSAHIYHAEAFPTPTLHVASIVHMS